MTDAATSEASKFEASLTGNVLDVYEMSVELLYSYTQFLDFICHLRKCCLEVDTIVSSNSLSIKIRSALQYFLAHWHNNYLKVKICVLLVDIFCTYTR